MKTMTFSDILKELGSTVKGSFWFCSSGETYFDFYKEEDELACFGGKLSGKPYGEPFRGRDIKKWPDDILACLSDLLLKYKQISDPLPDQFETCELYTLLERAKREKIDMSILSSAHGEWSMDVRSIELDDSLIDSPNFKSLDECIQWWRDNELEIKKEWAGEDE